MEFMIDAGHGLFTQGKGVPGMKEFEFNNAVASLVSKHLANYQDVVVRFAHDSSGRIDIPLNQRTDLANRYKVKAYVSIHANAASPTVRGIETFVYTSRPSGSTKLANAVHEELIKLTGMKDRGVKAQNFHVLRETNMDAILAECGFMTNKEDLKLLLDAEYREKCAVAIVNGLAKTYGLKKKVVTEKVDVVPVKSPHTYRFAKFVDTSDERVIASLRSEGYKLIDVPK